MSEASAVWEVIQRWLDLQAFPPNQTKLGQAVGVSRSAVSDWKIGKSHPSPHNLRRLNAVLEPSLGPDTYTLLMEALLRDMGLVEMAGVRDRHPRVRFRPMKDGNTYSIMEGLPTEAEMREVFPDDEDDLIDPIREAVEESQPHSPPESQSAEGA